MRKRIEKESDMSTQALTIVIVGGVAGGASAATRARRMNENARIVLFEKDAFVSFANCGLPYYIGGEIKERERLLVAKVELLEKRFKLEVHVRHEVTAIDRARKCVTVKSLDRGAVFEQPYDKLILSPGAAPILPPVKGVHAGNVMTLRNLDDTDRIRAAATREGARRAVVVGAGFIGLELAEQLRALGLKVALVELNTQVLPLLDREMARPIEEELIARGVELHLGVGVREVALDPEGLARGVVLDSGPTLAADFVVFGIGVRPNTALAEKAGLELGASGGIATNAFMQTADHDIYAVGDAAEYPYRSGASRLRVPLAGPANRAGRLAGEHAATGKSTEMPVVFGTAIVRVCSKTAGLTGLSARMAKKLGIPFKSVTIVAGHHAGYYPGAQPLTLKLIYAPASGAILGAQAVGAEGIDKRIDVIATAMAFKGTVRDLAGLDLAYAPPFASAKDPIHMAGFAATNALDGHVEFIDADTDLSELLVIDVRTPDEISKLPFAQGGRVAAIPLDELRARLDTLDKTKPTVVSCAVGLRGYVAARILKQNGFTDVKNLSGGALLRRRAVQ